MGTTTAANSHGPPQTANTFTSSSATSTSSAHSVKQECKHCALSVSSGSGWGPVGGAIWGPKSCKNLRFFKVFAIFLGLCSEAVLGGSWGPSWGHLGVVLRPFSAVLGLSWGRLGRSWVDLRASSCHLGAVFSVFGPSWVCLWASCGHLWAVWGHLGSSWGHLGSIFVRLVAAFAVLGRSSAVLGDFEGPAGKAARKEASKTGGQQDTKR